MKVVNCCKAQHYSKVRRLWWREREIADRESRGSRAWCLRLGISTALRVLHLERATPNTTIFTASLTITTTSPSTAAASPVGLSLTFPTIPYIACIAYSEQLWVPRPICSTTGQQLGLPTLPHQKDVFVPYPESIHQIHPRFRGERHAGLKEGRMVALVQIGAFVGYLATSA